MNRFVVAALVVCVLAASAFAQGSTTGRLTGTVSGPDGVIAGATITVTDSQTNKEVTVQSNDEGAFTVPQLEFGVYTVRVTSPGFSTFVANELKIDAGNDYSLNPTLQVGEVTSTVEVVAGADVINSSDGQLDTTISPRQVKELPINGRNPLSLLNLVAGANPTSGSINGQRSSSVNYTRDGLNVQDNFIRNGFVSDQPSVDDTGEFNVITQNAGAEFGSGSTQVQLVTPRGGADFNGNLFAFNRNSYFAANSFFNNLNVNAQGVGVPRAFLNRNQFGGSLGGPAALPNFGEGGPALTRGKAFFYVNYEGFRLANQVSAVATTLLPTAQNGTFTYIDNAGAQRTVNVLSGAGLNAPPANAAAPAALQLDPLIQSRFLSQLPTTGNGNLTGINFLQVVNFNRANPETRNAVTGRFDIDFNEQNTFNFVFKRNKNTDARTDIAAGFNTGTFASQGGPTTLYVLAYRFTPTANFSNEIRGGYQRSEPFFTATNDPTSLPFLVTLPFGTNPEASFQSQGRNTDYYNIQDNASLTLGNHSLRFGAQLQAYRFEALNNAGITANYSITGTGNPLAPTIAQNLFPGGINNTDFARANGLRFLLAGVVGSGVQTANATTSTSGFVPGAQSRRLLEFENIAGYVADQWRVTPQLTLNLGLRYEIYTPLRDPIGLYLEPIIPNGAVLRDALLSPTGGFQLVGGNAGNRGDFYKTDKNNFGPNVSFAYSPTFKNSFLNSFAPGEGRTVLRGGFRVGYVNDEYVRAPDNALLNNVGLGSTNAFATANGSTQFSVINISNAQTLAPVITPPSAFGPGGSGTRTFLENNRAAGGNGLGGLGGTISLVDPNLQVQRTYEYNISFEREIGFQSAIQFSYVGGRSNQLVRSIDFNQVEIRSNGFLADFNRAPQNLSLAEARRAQISADTSLTAAQRTTALALVPISGAFNTNVAGSQQLPLLSTLPAGGTLAAGGGLASNAVLTNLRNGTPADLVAGTYIPFGIGNSSFLPNVNAGVVNILTNGGRYNYNALQTEFRRRFTQGLSLQANYTFQKILTNVTAGDEFNQTRVEPFLDNANQDRDYSRPLYDRSHTFNFNGLYELPFGRGKRFFSESGVLDRIVGGLQFSSIVNISSGQPVTITDARGTLNRAGRSGVQPATSSLTDDQIKDLTGIFRTPNGVFFINPSVLFATARNASTGQTLTGIDLTQQLPAGFAVTEVRGANPVGTAPFAGQVFFPNEPGSTGNLQRNFIDGPLYLNWDAGLLKNVRITEGSRLQLRAEVFNVLNRANFFSGFYDVGSTNFGRITSTYTNLGNQRVLQFGARFEF